MASPAHLDFQALLSPIPGEAPAGPNLREDFSPTSVYYRVKDARTAARAAERYATASSGEEEDAPRPDWQKVLDLAPDILAEKSKDLEVTAWLIEGLARTYGFAGLRDGFRLARELVDGFWDGLHPQPDEDGLLTKVAPLSGLNGEGSEGTLIAPIAMIPIIQGSSYAPFAAWHYNQAREGGALEDEARIQKRIDAGIPTMEMVQKSIAETEKSFFGNLIEDLQQCLQEYDALTAALDSRCASDAPPSSNIRQALSEVQQLVGFITKGMFPNAAAAGGAVEGADVAQGDPAPAGAPASSNNGALTNREDAFQSLLRIAEYFRQAEPHSPLSYLLEQAVRWGNMSLPELVNQLIPDKGARSNYLKLTGIPGSED